MRRIDIEVAMRRRPFQPFRMALTNGEYSDVVHPDLAIVGQRFIAVGSPHGKSPDDELIVYWINLIHIVYIRRL